MTEQATPNWDAIYPTTEQGLEAACKELCRSPSLWDVMAWPPVSRIRRQFRLGKAISDLLLEHEDGSITLIEVKSPGLSLRDYCTGIGQLAYQTIMAMSHFQARTVRKVLATPGPVSVDLVFACEAAGVDIMPTMTMEQWRASLVDVDEALIRAR